MPTSAPASCWRCFCRGRWLEHHNAMKYLLVLIVVGVGIWMLAARFRKRPPIRQGENGSVPGAPAAQGPGTADGDPRAQAPARIVACSHCGLHLPAQEAVFDDEVPYCGSAHRQAGPR